MSVSQSNIKAMGDIMAKFNSIIDEKPLQPSLNEQTHHGDPKVHAMGEIMSRFRKATETVVNDAENDPVLMEALQTEKTPTGIKIAEWEISERANGPRVFYDIRNVHTNTLIAEDIRLYEAAYALVKALNEGNTVNSKQIRKILVLEEQFSKHLHDASNYKRIASKSNGKQSLVAEDRYSIARSKALHAKRMLSEMYEQK